MTKYTVFVTRPQKIEVEAESYEEAIVKIRATLKIYDNEPVTFENVSAEASWQPHTSANVDPPTSA